MYLSCPQIHWTANWSPVFLPRWRGGIHFRLPVRDMGLRPFPRRSHQEKERQNSACPLRQHHQLRRTLGRGPRSENENRSRFVRAKFMNRFSCTAVFFCNCYRVNILKWGKVKAKSSICLSVYQVNLFQIVRNYHLRFRLQTTLTIPMMYVAYDFR